MLDITTWPGDVDSFVDATIWLVGRMPADPEHFCRSYTSAELDRITTARPRSSSGVGAREMGYRVRYTLATELVNELVEAADGKVLARPACWAGPGPQGQREHGAGTGGGFVEHPPQCLLLQRHVPPPFRRGRRGGGPGQRCL
ncbi:hypothetical protein ACFSKW_44790 [Nonomuraea mangrovi]|uniref:Uncharacterized protein n=1 Tax=Nonomuraea mangrovi TaxID=2316207 RepID=A0ABW4TBW6_9ACTN